MWKTRCRRCSKVHMITQPCPRCEAARVKAELAESIVESEIDSGREVLEEDEVKE